MFLIVCSFVWCSMYDSVEKRSPEIFRSVIWVEICIALLYLFCLELRWFRQMLVRRGLLVVWQDYVVMMNYVIMAHVFGSFFISQILFHRGLLRNRMSLILGSAFLLCAFLDNLPLTYLVMVQFLMLADVVMQIVVSVYGLLIFNDPIEHLLQIVDVMSRSVMLRFINMVASSLGVTLTCWLWLMVPYMCIMVEVFDRIRRVMVILGLFSYSVLEMDTWLPIITDMLFKWWLWMVCPFEAYSMIWEFVSSIDWRPWLSMFLTLLFGDARSRRQKCLEITFLNDSMVNKEPISVFDNNVSDDAPISIWTDINVTGYVTECPDVMWSDRYRLCRSERMPFVDHEYGMNCDLYSDIDDFMSQGVVVILTETVWWQDLYVWLCYTMKSYLCLVYEC